MICVPLLSSNTAGDPRGGEAEAALAGADGGAAAKPWQPQSPPTAAGRGAAGAVGTVGRLSRCKTSAYSALGATSLDDLQASPGRTRCGQERIARGPRCPPCCAQGAVPRALPATAMHHIPLASTLQTTLPPHSTRVQCTICLGLLKDCVSIQPCGREWADGSGGGAWVMGSRRVLLGYLRCISPLTPGSQPCPRICTLAPARCRQLLQHVPEPPPGVAADQRAAAGLPSQVRLPERQAAKFLPCRTHSCRGSAACCVHAHAVAG